MKTNLMKENSNETANYRKTGKSASIQTSNINEESINADNNSPVAKFRTTDTGAFNQFENDNKNNSQSSSTISHRMNEPSERNNLNTDVVNTSGNKLIVNYSRNEVKEKVTNIFMNFAKYYKEDKQFFLSQQALIKIFKKLNLIDENTLKLSDVDLILRKINPHSNKINEHQFLDFIVKIVNKMYPQEYSENARNSVNFFISNVFEPYSKYIEEIQLGIEEGNGQTGQFPLRSIETLIQRTFDSQVNAILNSVYFAIKEIYFNYFHYEINKYKDIKKIDEGSLKDLTDFCKDFEILPYMINLDQLVTYYNMIVRINIKQRNNFLTYEKDDKEIGNYFTLKRFCLMFFHFSIISYFKNNTFGALSTSGSKSVTDVDKLLLFLEKLENSNGFQNLERRTSKPHTCKLTLIPSKNVLGLIDCNIFKSDFKDTVYSLNNNKLSQNESTTNIKKIKEFNQKVKNNQNFDLKSLLSVDEEVFGFINDKIEKIKEMFSYYSKIGEKQNIDRMNMSSFFKFLKDCDIIATNHSHAELKQDPLHFSKNNKVLSKSPLKYTSMSMKNMKDSISSTLNNRLNDKLTESDANVIFYTLTGHKNFDNSLKIRQQFDKNSGNLGSYDGKSGFSRAHSQSKMNSNKNTIALRMDFFLFIKSFELLAGKLYPDMNLNKSVMELFEKNLNRLIQSRKTFAKGALMSRIIQKIAQPEIKNFLIEFEPIMFIYYENFSDTHFMMSFEQFKDFYKSFSLFPDLVNLTQVKHIFSTLAEAFASDNQGKSTFDLNEIKSDGVQSHIKRFNNTNLINFPLFLQSLAMTAMFFKFDDKFRDLDKILYLLERMNQSKGLKNIQLKSGKTFTSSRDLVTFLLSIKEKYPEFYNNKLNNIEVKVPVSFDDLYDEDNC